MKKWKIALPTLLATSGLPLVSLVGCGNKPGPDPTLKDMTIKLAGGGDVPESIDINKEITLVAYDDQGVVDNVTFATQSKTIILDGNKVTGKSKGTATITCTAEGYNETSCSFSVVESVEEEMYIKLVGGGAVPQSMDVNQALTLAAYDEKGVVNDAIFATDSENIILKDNKVTGLSGGEATITCTAEGHKKASWNFTVTEIEPEPIVDSVQLDKWNGGEGYLYKNNLICEWGDAVTIKINFKKDWDPNQEEKKEILGQFHLINDSKYSYNFDDNHTSIFVDDSELRYDTQWTWKWGEHNKFYISILDKNILEQLINTEKVEIKTQIEVGSNPGSFGFYAI